MRMQGRTGSFGHLMGQQPGSGKGLIDIDAYSSVFRRGVIRTFGGRQVDSSSGIPDQFYDTEARHCATADCGTKLNRYHNGETCYLHEGR